MLRINVEAQSGRHPPSPDTPDAARITRAHKLRHNLQRPRERGLPGFVFMAVNGPSEIIRGGSPRFVG